MMRSTWTIKSKGRKIIKFFKVSDEYLNLKILIFYARKKFKTSSPINEMSIGVIFKFIISVRGQPLYSEQ
jgi:hypothetical protein